MNTQIIQQPFLYVNNLPITWLSNTTFSIGAGQCRDSLNATDFTLSSLLTVNVGVNGVNALDVGTLAASTWYYVYIIGQSLFPLTDLPAALVSLSATAPTLPSGYDTFRLIGFMRTDSSSHLLKAYTVGTGTSRTNYWDAGIQVLNAGTATTFTAVDCSAAVPPVDNTPVVFDTTFIPATAGDGVNFRPTGSAATQVDGMTGVVAAKAQEIQLKMLTKLASSVAKIDYKNSAAAGSTTLYVRAFDYFI